MIRGSGVQVAREAGYAAGDNGRRQETLLHEEAGGWQETLTMEAIWRGSNG